MKSRLASISMPAAALTRRQVNKGLGTLGMAAAASPLISRHALARTDPLVMTWAGWDVPELHQEYIDRYGSEPRFSFFADSQEQFTKVYAGFSADIVEIGSSHVRKWVDAELIVPIDPSRLKYWDDLFEPMRTLDVQWHNGDLYFMPTMYGGVSILYRADMVDIEEESWSMLWDERYEGLIAPIDFPVEALVQIGLGLGVANPWAMTDAELEEVRETLKKQARLSKFYWDNPTVVEQALISGEIAIASAWSEMAPRVANQGVPIVYANPKEGRLATQDGLAISSTRDVDLERIYAYIDARISPEAGKFCMESFGMINPNSKALDITPADVVKGMGADNLEANMKAAQSWKTMTPEDEQKYVELYNEVRAGF